MAGRRLSPPAGHGVDRSRPVAFRFDGLELEGYIGDTLASGLLANGVEVVARSPLMGRPRGVFSAGVEEPNAFVEVSAPSLQPIVPATTTTLVPSLVAESRPGVGRLPPNANGSAPTALHRHVHVETLVIGGGVAGLRAALEAAQTGDRVMLVDERSWLGGTAAIDDQVDGSPARSWVATAAGALASASDVSVLVDATALGIYDDGYVVVHERSTPVERLHHVRARRVVVATGAHERPIGFARNDLPGVMLASAARTYADRFGVVPGERAVVFSTNQAGHDAAVALARAGLEITVIVDPGDNGSASAAAEAAGIEVRTGWAVAAAAGDPGVRSVTLTGPDGESDTVDADVVLVSGGWNPTTQLWRAIGGGLRYDDERACFVPDGDGPAWLSIVGAAAGDVPACVPCWYSPADDLSEHFVDLQRDATVADVLEAVGHELRSAEHVKRATYIGTAIDQGRTSGALTAAIVSRALAEGPGAQGPTNSRPPYTPVPFSVLAGPDRGSLLDPVRTTPIHARHVERGAVFENVGQWKRPWYFPLPGESMRGAVERECLAVRRAAGVMDASTLGKIELVGPDAGVFLDRLYTNRMSTLAVGSIRYGLMLGLDGMVFDDGVAMRLDDERFLITTTTGGAAKVLDHLEEWLQTEWPDLRVYATSVTEQWATIAVNGPLARDVLTAAGTDIDLGGAAFPFMTWREGLVAGVDARVARVSFSGELAYEINVDGHHGLAMWDAVLAAGEPLGLTPYGTETMHVLRAEKGFMIVGQDTDGTVTPHDLGMSWIVRKDDSDFIGRRSLRRPDTARPGRNQLVGLLPVDPDRWLPEGAQIVSPERASDEPPVPMLGHVTSSYRSPVLGRTFALAMIAGGRDRIGGHVVAPTFDGPIEAEVVWPAFYDPEGSRRDG